MLIMKNTFPERRDDDIKLENGWYFVSNDTKIK
jgi:hypothetical protein